MKAIHFFLLLLGASLPASDFTLESAVTHALAHNPDLAAARFRIDEARGKVTGAGRLSNPDLEISASKMTAGKEGNVGIAFMQKFPVTGRLRFEKAVTRAELAAAEAEFENEKRKVAEETRLVMVKLLALEQRRTLAGEQLENGRQMAKLATARAGAGAGSTTEAIQFELEAQELQFQVLTLDTEKPALLGELRVLLGMKPGEPLTTSGALPPAGKISSLQTDPEKRADLHGASMMVEAAQRGIELERSKRYEDIAVGAMVERARRLDMPEPLMNETMLGIKISIPLPFWNKNEGPIEQATAAAQRAAKEREAMALRIRFEIAVAYGEMKAQVALVNSVNDTLLPKATEVEKRILDQYKQGQLSIQDVLRARDKRLQLERSRIDALRDYHLARARWLAATGQ